ncbi:hypothetical protein V8E54_012739 [Elaphomyces granulatus]
MKYTLSAEEEGRIREQMLNLPKGIQSLTRNSLRVSGSQWKEEHLKVFRVVYLDNLAINRFFDGDYIPTNDDNVFFQMAKDISVTTEDNLREYTKESSEETRPNPFFVIPNTCLVAMFIGILGPSSVSDLGGGFSLAAVQNAQRVRVWLGGRGPINVVNDGGIVLKSHGTYTGSNRLGEIPIISFEAKRRHAGGQVHAAGEQETPTANIRAQQFAELLGQAMSTIRYLDTDEQAQGD